MSNRQWLFSKRPEGALRLEHFEWRVTALPSPGPGEVLVRVSALSVDPAQRMWMSIHSYRKRLEPGEVMPSYAVGEVVESCTPGFAPGDVVSGDLGWQDYAVVPGGDLRLRDGTRPLAQLLGVLDITGLTAYFGLLEVARPLPGETVLVSGAAGAVGSIALQIARLAGCRTVGVAGGAEKCRWLVDELGADAAVDYKRGELRTALRQACPSGIDVMFDNTAGETLEAALLSMNHFGRVACCGAVSQYDQAGGTPGPRGVPALLIARRIRMQGFVVFDHYARRDQAEAQLARWLDEGKLKAPVHEIAGLENAPQMLIGQLAGVNIGKAVVTIA